jgi:ribosome biogenesis GTPase
MSNKSNWTDDEMEDAYIGNTRRADRKERKRRILSDRSQYKKTDQKQALRLKAIEDEGKDLLEGETRGRVLSILSQGMIVACLDTDKKWNCVLRGNLKQKRTMRKNLIAVGDFVHFEKIDETDAAISYVEPRISTLSRADALSQNKEQIIATNIDQVLITSSICAPRLKPSLIDRYVIAAHKGNMKPVIVINKMDLIEEDPEEKELLEKVCEAYRSAGIPIILMSADSGDGIDKLKECMKDKASVFSGQSGVGKSSLINKMTGLDLTVRETVDRTRKGAHTTTTAQLIPLAFGGWCVDTPGIKSFGLWNLGSQEIEEYFNEIHELSGGCKYPNCTHTHETDCAVKAALEEGQISEHRYASYCDLFLTIDEKHLRR